MCKGCEPRLDDGLSIVELMADPSVCFALKTVIRDWSSRDCVDAARDASVLCRLFGREADLRLGSAP